MSLLAGIDVLVLRKFAKGPRWMRSLGIGVPVARRLIDAGYLERHKPEGGKAENMARLTPKGSAALGIAPIAETQLDRLAELLSQGLTVHQCAERLGTTYIYANAMLQRIRSKLGPQAI